MSANDRYQSITTLGLPAEGTPKKGLEPCRVNVKGSPLGRGNEPGSIISRLTRWASLLAVLTAMIIVIEPLASASTFGSGTLVSAPPAQQGGGIGLVVGLIDDLIDIIEDVVRDADDAEQAIGGDMGPLAEPIKSEVAGYLDNVEQLIDKILDSSVYPSLDPPYAGSEVPIVSPTTLPEYAVDCRDLAQDALDEARSRIVDYETIGTDLRNIKSLLPAYRDEAGI